MKKNQNCTETYSSRMSNVTKHMTLNVIAKGYILRCGLTVVADMKLQYKIHIEQNIYYYQHPTSLRPLIGTCSCAIVASYSVLLYYNLHVGPIMIIYCIVIATCM